MDNDDQQIGRILSRREVLSLLTTAGAAVLVGCEAAPDTAVIPTTGASATSAPTAGLSLAPSAAAPTSAATPAINAEAQTAVSLANNPTAQSSQAAEATTAEAANAAIVPSCVVRPEVTEGPYYVEEDLVRSDIRTDSSTGTAKAGTPLVLTFTVSQVASNACTALQGATVEIWHCDAAGQYSDVTDRSFDTQGQNWLRGSQVTDASGKATFTTIYPGWYASRAVHIHFKVHPNENAVFTSQLFFDDSLSDQVFTQAPYASKGQRDTLNSNDSIYQELLLLSTSKTDTGYAATFPIGIDLSTLGTGESGGQGGGPGGGPGGQPPSGTPPSGGRPGGPPSGTAQPAGTTTSGG